MANDELPLAYDIRTRRGDTYRRRVTITDSSTGAGDDLSGATLLAQVRETSNSDTVLFTLETTPDADQVANPGLLDLVIPSATTSTFPKDFVDMRIGYWDLQVTWPSGDVTTYLEGEVVSKGDISR
jgi:hypothetical protein